MKTITHMRMFTLTSLLALITIFNSNSSWGQDSVPATQTPATHQLSSAKSNNQSKSSPSVEINPALYGEEGQADNTTDMTPYENESGAEESEE